MRNIVIFDIDGTLADIRHRVHFVSSSEKAERDWKSFNAAMCSDVPINDVCVICRHLKAAGFRIWLFTGRQEMFKPYTEQWLFWNNIPYDKLQMRPENDMRPDFECKSDMLTKEEEDNIAWIFEDKQTVVDMWRKRGLTVFQCDNKELNKK